MEEICFHKDIFQYHKHIFLTREGSFYQFSDWEEETKKEGRISITQKELENLPELYSFEPIKFPNEKYLSIFENYKLDQNVPWPLVLSKKNFTRCVKEFGLLFQMTVSSFDLTYYNNIFKKYENCFARYLQPAKINPVKFSINSLLEQNNSVLQSFKPDKDGFASIPMYSFFTTTGRSKIVSGPNILRLKKEHRNILTSRFGENGDLWYFDYSSLEPRVALAARSIGLDYDSDIYESVNKKIFSGSYPRDVIKTVVLSILYGAGETEKREIQEQLKVRKNEVEQIFESINSFFQIKEFKEELINKNDANGRKYIENFYGRRVSTKNARPYVLPNYFVQSTAVDVAMLGFTNIFDYLKKEKLMQFVVPVFGLHDALILDIKNTFEYEIEDICKVATTEIPKFSNGTFKIKATRLI